MDPIKVVNNQIVANICELRKKSGMTQKEMADQLSEITGHIYTAANVSAWERGITPPPMAIIPFVCEVLKCPSYKLFSQSRVMSERDLRLIDFVRSMDEEYKDILDRIVVEWPGNIHNLIKVLSAYTLLDDYRRSWIVRSVLHEFRDAVASKELDASDVTVGEKEILQFIKELTNEEE